MVMGEASYLAVKPAVYFPDLMKPSWNSAGDVVAPEDLASNVAVGMRLPSAQVVRFCDSKPLHLMKSLKSDGNRPC
jgi:hypothetical protein